MGIISKQIHKARTAKQFVPVSATTSLDETRIFAIADAVVQAYVPKKLPNPKWNLRGDPRLWLDPSSEPHSKLVLCQSPQLKDLDHHAGLQSALWIIKLSVVDQSTHNLIQMLPLRGRTNDGLLLGLNLFSQFATRFLGTIEADDPTFRMVDPA